MKLELILGEVILTLNGISRILSPAQVITVIGAAGVLYHRETSLYCLAFETLTELPEEDLEIFMNYQPQDWLNMEDYVNSLYDNEVIVTNCREN